MPGAQAASPRRIYLLLSLTSLFWAGNVVIGRFIAGHVPPITLSVIRWGGATALLLPVAARHLARDWPLIRKRALLLAFLALTGFSAYTRWLITACNTPRRSTGCCCN